MTEAPNTPTGTGCGHQIAWLGAGFVLPFYSPEFYLAATRKPLRSALLFFAVLMTLVAGLTTARLNRTLESFRQQALEAFEAGTIPVITITDGTATVEGEDPFIVTDGDKFFFAVDTNSTLDRDSFLEYDGGFLITKTIAYSYAGGRSQGIELSNYNLAFGRDPLVLDEPLVGQFFGSVSIVYTILAGVAIWVWDVGLWLLFLVISGYFLWGPINQALPEFSFRSMLAIGIYAHLPALTIQHILSLFGVKFFFIYTTLLLVFWVGALYLVLREVAGELISARGEDAPKIVLPTEPAQPPRLWPAWLGLPALGFISANAVFTWEFAPLWVLGSIAITIAILLFIDSYLHREPEEEDKIE